MTTLPLRPSRVCRSLSAMDVPMAMVLLLALAWATPARAHPRDDLFGRDKALHFAVSAGIAGGGYGATALFTAEERPRLLIGGGLALLAGIGKEIADHYTGGDPSWRDLGWDVVGTATGLGVGLLVSWLWRLSSGG